MKHIYLFNETNSNAAMFGVGNYIRQLLACLKESKTRVTVISLLSDYEQVTVCMEEGVRHIYIPCLVPKSANRKHYLRSVTFIILPFITAEEENIFHYNYLDSLDLAIWLRHYIDPAVHLLTIHYRKPGIFENFDRESQFVNEACDKIIVLTQYAAVNLRYDYHLCPKKIEIVPNGIQDNFHSITLNQKVELKQKMGIPLSKRIILYVGRFDSNKNPQLLIESFERLLTTRDDVHLILAGKGNYDVLFSSIKHYGNISFTGFLPYESLNTVYSIADIGIIPSQYEEFGYTAIEMMMHGIPIIANRTLGLQSIIQEGKAGELVNLYVFNKKEESVEVLFQAMSSLLNDEKRQKSYSYKAREEFLKYYRLEHFKRRMFDIYSIIS